MILSVYKEKGWTSHDVVAKLRGVLSTKKIGHAGTLDPLAEGVLVVLTDKDTKKQSEIMELPKQYTAEITFGATSPTYDMEGPLSFFEDEIDAVKLKKNLENLLPGFTGKIKQKVPPYSAVKVDGKKLYKKARAGEAVDLPVKEVEAYGVELEGFATKEVEGRVLSAATLRIDCGKGFYVRSLAHDLGEKLGTGAVLTKLVRTKVGDYKLAESKKISDFEKR